MPENQREKMVASRRHRLMPGISPRRNHPLYEKRKTQRRTVSEIAEGRGALLVLWRADIRLTMSRSTSIGDWLASTS